MSRRANNKPFYPREDLCIMATPSPLGERARVRGELNQALITFIPTFPPEGEGITPRSLLRENRSKQEAD